MQRSKKRAYSNLIVISMKILLLSCIMLLPISAWSQTAVLRGRVVDGRTRAPMAGATVRLIYSNDTTNKFSTMTGEEGRFALSGIGILAYDLEVTFVGYTPLSKFVRIDKPVVDLGDLLMMQSAVRMPDVVVEGKAVPAVQKADTTEINAKAFKTNPDADAQDLVTKMPGVTVDNGTVKAQGENVGQVLVDGKPFFGNDPTLALRSLPADAVEKIQIYDKMSDQAEFTGFDDGQSIKTLNVITRAERRNQQFGKTYGGYGDDDRYIGGGGINYFHGDTRASIIGLSNNVNQQNFSTQDLLGVVGNANQRGGGGGRRGGGGGGGGGGFGGGFQGGGANTSNFLVGQQNGITTTNSVGMNYTDKWAGSLTLTQSYFFNLTSSGNAEVLDRQYFGAPDSTTLYNESSGVDTRNFNHRIDTKLEYLADSSNSIIVQPRLYFQNNHSSSLLNGVTTLSSGQIVSQTDNNNQTSTSGYNLSNHLVLRHKFAAPGRTISIDFGAGANRKQGAGLQQSYSTYYDDSTSTIDTANQRSPLLTDGYNLSLRIVYTEPIGTNSQLMMQYSPSYSKNESDNKKFRLDPASEDYSIQINALSNTYENQYTTHNAGLMYRYHQTGANLMAGVSYQVASLRGEQEYPFATNVTKTFYDLLPNAMMQFNLAEHTNLRLFYRTSTSPPQLSQMQNVIDNSNPLLLTSGNSDLKQSYTHTFLTRFAVTNPGSSRSMFLFFTLGYTGDYIGNSTVTGGDDTVRVRGIRLNPGTQLASPVNLDGYWTARTFFTYGLPAEFLSSNLNLNTEIAYTQTPGLISGKLNLAKTTVLSQGAVLGSNISENVDFTLSYTGNYSIARYTLQPDQNSHYFYHTAGMKLNLIFWEGFVFRNEVTNILYTGLTGGYDQNYFLWNISLGKKLFSNQRGEIRGAVTDLLNQNKSVTRTVSDTYLEDAQNKVLGRYFMVMFTYTVR